MPMNDDPNARVWEENQQLKAKLDAETDRADRAVRSVIDTTKELMAAEVKLANAIAAKEKAEAALREILVIEHHYGCPTTELEKEIERLKEDRQKWVEAREVMAEVEDMHDADAVAGDWLYEAPSGGHRTPGAALIYEARRRIAARDKRRGEIKK